MERPVTDSDRLHAIEDLRPLGTLRALVDAFETLLEDGPPQRGRSQDSREAYDAWLERNHELIKRGRTLIEGLAVPLDSTVAVAGPRRPT